MPKLIQPSADMETGSIPGLTGYAFSGIRLDRLGASEYTLVTIAADISGSVSRFRDLLVETIKKAVGACRKSPKAGNILLRVVTFNDDVTEIHGFKPLSDIKDSDYDSIDTRGSTALFDVAASSVGAMVEFGRKLVQQDYGVNALLFIITDGSDTASKFGPSAVKQKMEEAVTGEVLESCLSVLVGVNAAQYRAELEAFQREGGITQYVDAGAATPGNLAKLAAFISRSVSSQTNAVGTGQAGALASAAIVI